MQIKQSIDQAISLYFLRVLLPARLDLHTLLGGYVRYQGLRIKDQRSRLQYDEVRFHSESWLSTLTGIQGPLSKREGTQWVDRSIAPANLIISCDFGRVYPSDLAR